MENLHVDEERFSGEVKLNDRYCTSWRIDEKLGESSAQPDQCYLNMKKRSVPGHLSFVVTNAWKKGPWNVETPFVRGDFCVSHRGDKQSAGVDHPDRNVNRPSEHDYTYEVLESPLSPSQHRSPQHLAWLRAARLGDCQEVPNDGITLHSIRLPCQPRTQRGGSNDGLHATEFVGGTSPGNPPRNRTSCHRR